MSIKDKPELAALNILDRRLGDIKRPIYGREKFMISVSESDDAGVNLFALATARKSDVWIDAVTSVCAKCSHLLMSSRDMLMKLADEVGNGRHHSVSERPRWT